MLQRSLLCLGAATLVACGNGNPPPDDPSKDAFGGVVCSAVRPQTEPDLMGWDSGSRAKLNRLRNQGIVAVRYKAVGCNVELEVIENCIGENSYRYEAYAASDSKTARNTREVFAEFPLGVGRLGAMVKNGRMLRTDYLMVGTVGLPPDANVRLSDLRGNDCRRATHVVRTVYLGGFAMASGTSEELGGSGSLFGIGAGAKSGATTERVASEGVANACDLAQKDGKATPLCSVPLRIALLPIQGLPEPSEDASSPPAPAEFSGRPASKHPGQPTTSGGGDRDSDGILDRDDKCPDEPEDKDGFQDDDGCPDPDNDGDGILDINDRCPNEAGPASTGGCPVKNDRDNDGILDAVDACPDVPGVASPDPKNNGCPPVKSSSTGPATPRVTVDSRGIALSEKIVFLVGRGTINPQSHSLLDELATALTRDPSINLSVEGHSDNMGSASANLQLTQDRADAVKAYLVSKGVAAARLTAVGYGQNKPIAPNVTDEGRSRNRRIELVRR
jgi:outer membrane protein OmpA-like peptidoglycan-associated protein